MYYSPVRHSSPGVTPRVTVRLACVKHAASVQSEPGSNSSVQSILTFASPLSRTSLSLKAISKEITSHVSTSITLKASSQDRRLCHPFQDKINRAITLYPFPRSAPKSRSTHTHRLFRFLKSNAVFPAAVSGEGRIIRIEIGGSTLFGVFHSQNSLFGRAERTIATPNRQDSSTRANLRFPTWMTNGPPVDNLRALSLTLSPLSFTPPCSIMRIASDVLAVSPACLRI